MREHRVHQLLLGRLQRHRHDISLDQLGHLGPDHVGAEQLAGFGIEDRLDQSVGLAKGDGFAQAPAGATNTTVGTGEE